MNLAITTTSARTWKAAKTHSLLVLAGAAIALSAVVGATSFAGDGTEKATPPSASKSGFEVPAGTITPHPAMTYYIVDSVEQQSATLFEATRHADDLGVYDQGNRWKFSIVLLSGVPDEDEEALRSIDRERARWERIGASGLEIVDLRGR